MATRSPPAPTSHRWPTVRSGWPAPSLVERCEHLLAVCSAGAGYDVIDVEACTRAGIAVCNNSGPGAEAVAEHALGFMLDLAKKITVADRVLRSGELGDRLALRGSQLLGKTLGVIGLGAIGSGWWSCARRSVWRCSSSIPYLDDVAAQVRGVQRVDAVRTGRAIRLRPGDLPADRRDRGPHRQGPVRRDEADRFLHHHRARTGARRGGAARCTRRGGIAGAGLDVFHEEPPRQDNPLLHLDNVVATPHTAGITVEAVRDIAIATATQWQTIFDGRMPPRLLNPDVWPRYCERFHDDPGGIHRLRAPAVATEHAAE